MSSKDSEPVYISIDLDPEDIIVLRDIALSKLGLSDINDYVNKKSFNDLDIHCTHVTLMHMHDRKESALFWSYAKSMIGLKKEIHISHIVYGPEFGVAFVVSGVQVYSNVPHITGIIRKGRKPVESIRICKESFIGHHDVVAIDKLVFTGTVVGH